MCLIVNLDVANEGEYVRAQLGIGGFDKLAGLDRLAGVAQKVGQDRSNENLDTAKEGQTTLKDSTPSARDDFVIPAK